MEERLIATGKLYPQDHIGGCLYEIYQITDSKIRVKLWSPNGNYIVNSLVAESIIEYTELMNWLMLVVDY